MQITISSDKMFEIINENYVFERLNIADFNREDLKSILQGSHLDSLEARQKLMEIKDSVERRVEVQPQDGVDE